MEAAIDPKEQLARVVAHIDRHHPRLGARLMRARYGGLRVVEPSRPLAAAVFAGGVAAGVAVRRLVGGLTGGEVRPVSPVVVGPLVAWTALWRWDSVRWRRRHVVLVLDLPPARLDELVAELAASGLAVERWDGRKNAGGASTGISCRLRDLRRVNAELDRSAVPELA